MIRFEGKDVLTELRELASPRRAALLLVDMQQDMATAAAIQDVWAAEPAAG